MKKRCENLQMLMAEKGPLSLRDDMAAQEHLAECTECFEFLEAHSIINEKLSDTSHIDAPDEVVNELVAYVADMNKVSDCKFVVTKKDKSEFKLITSLLKVFRWIIETGEKCICGFFLILLPYKRGIAFCIVFIVIGASMFSMVAPRMIGRAGSAREVRMKSEQRMKMRSEIETIETRKEPLKHAKSAPATRSRVEKKKAIAGKREKQIEFAAKDSFKEHRAGEGARKSNTQADSTMNELIFADNDDMGDEGMVGYLEEEEDSVVEASEEKSLIHQDFELEIPDELEEPLNEIAGMDQSYISSDLKKVRKPALKQMKTNIYGKVGKNRLSDTPSEIPLSIESDSSGKMILETFFSERASLENLIYKKTDGYWANTYLPGDPVYRWLDSHLGQWDRSKITSYMNRSLELDGNARRIKQPFDSPVTSALGVFLHSDRRGIQGESRMLVQIGIKGTQRFSGSRPGMNVGIVLDLRGHISDENINCFKALLTAFSKAKDLGDRFSLTIAGKSGGVIIRPGDFKYGHLSIAMKHLFGEEEDKGETLGLVEAIKGASALVSSGDDPTAPLGSSEVFLVTSQSLEGLSDTLAAFAHNSAVAGGPVSVIGIGQKINPAELNQIIYSGQGNRRLFGKPSDAARVVEQELTAVSKVIARAVRLRIRLAGGVKLVNVFDSHRLDEAMSQKVRDAEKSIDQRMSKNLGIQADRGDDEDGIQIVIPAFYAGDSHVVLLDVVVPGPGPVADVTVRYKDLVKLKNGVVRANLSLDRSTALPGPLERNVLKNLLARKLSDSLVSAGDALISGHDGKALGLLQSHHALLYALRLNQPDFKRDADISDDIAMLEDYLAILNKGLDGIQKQRTYIADSLRFAGKLKVLPRLNK